MLCTGVLQHIPPADLEVAITSVKALAQRIVILRELAWMEHESDYIWAQRLDAARRALCDPACAARTVSEIAFSLGFNDAAHFSRAFRARFGCSPRDVRRQ